VNVYGLALEDGTGTTVTIGGSPASVLEVAAGVVVVRTPSGSGVADVVVESSAGRAVLPRAYTYLDPLAAARLGNVGVLNGAREDVLTVNGSAGGTERVVTLGRGEPIVVSMAAPSSLSPAPFALYAWRGEPDWTTITVQPFELGATVFPTPLNSGSSPWP